MNQFGKAQLLTMLKQYTNETLTDMSAESIDAVKQVYRDVQRYEPETLTVERLRKEYPRGSRIILISMGPDPRPIPDHTLGTVDEVDDIGTLHCDFDNGRRLGLIPGEDVFLKV